MLKLYGRRSSINVQKALWTLAELGLEFEWFDPDGTFGTIDVSDYKILNPNMRIPTLMDGDLVLRQSNAIVRYLCHKFSDGDLYPTDPGALATADVWMDWQNTELQATITPVFWGLVRAHPNTLEPGLIAANIEKLNATMEIMEAMFGGGNYVNGDTFTMGDIPPGAGVYRYMALDIARPALPKVEAYYARLQERPAYRKAVMTPLV